MVVIRIVAPDIHGKAMLAAHTGQSLYQMINKQKTKKETQWGKTLKDPGMPDNTILVKSTAAPVLKKKKMVDFYFLFFKQQQKLSPKQHVTNR